MLQPGHAGYPCPVPDASQTTLIYQRLRVAILDLDLAPGLRLTERWLESELDASRTPVRAALVRLESEGLAQRSGRGWIVSPIDLDELTALAEFREAVEVAVVRLACERASETELRSLGTTPPDAEHSTPEDDLSSEDTDPAVPDFHLRLAALSGNPFLVSAMEGIMTRLSRTRWLEVRTPAASAQAASEHEAIVRALGTRDADAAARLVVAHIRSTGSRLAESLKDNRKGLTARGMSIVGAAPTTSGAGNTTGAAIAPVR
jgi:DNA-binding GntR family transcriptional regulator